MRTRRAPSDHAAVRYLPSNPGSRHSRKPRRAGCGVSCIAHRERCAPHAPARSEPGWRQTRRTRHRRYRPRSADRACQRATRRHRRSRRASRGGVLQATAAGPYRVRRCAHERNPAAVGHGACSERAATRRAAAAARRHRYAAARGRTSHRHDASGARQRNTGHWNRFPAAAIRPSPATGRPRSRHARRERTQPSRRRSPARAMGCRG